MLFPPSDRVIFEINPLIEVICEFRTPAILRIESESPTGFQERIRSEYPEYEQEGDLIGQIPSEVADMLQRIGAPMPPSGGVHKFITSDGKQLVSIGRRRRRNLNQSFLALTDRDYVRWEQFKERIRQAEVNFAEEYSPSYYSRVGLRYRDHINRERIGLEGHSWGDLLQLPIAGILAESSVSDSVIQAMTTSEISLDGDIEDGRMILRYGLQSTATTNEEIFLLDIDCYKEGRIERGDVFGILEKFHEIEWNFFRWAISDITADALRPRALDAVG